MIMLAATIENVTIAILNNFLVFTISYTYFFEYTAYNISECLFKFSTSMKVATLL